MSSARGAGVTKQRAQKHKNTFAFKNDLHDKTPQMKRINQLQVNEVCERCKLQIEWKIKYKKYKPLSQAKHCIGCNQRTVKKAYHVLCKDCAKKSKCCAKCLQSAETVNILPPEPTPREEQMLKVEMDRLIKSLPERKRRTFLRFMKKGEETSNKPEEDNKEEQETTDQETAEDKPKIRRKRIPHTRDALLQKIELLRIAEDDDEDDDDLDTDDEGASDSDDYDHLSMDSDESDDERK